jgi:prepilin peptidase CpaA
VTEILPDQTTLLSALRLLAAALPAVAAWRDIATRTVPDTACILLAAIGLAGRAAEGGWAAPLLSLGLAAGLFLLLLPMAARGALGSGDVKLACAMVMGLSPAAAWDFVFATAMLGGVLGLGYIAGPALVPARAAAPPGGGATLFRRLLAVEAWRLRRRGPLPYAVAIAGGGILVLLTAATSTPGS